MSANEITTSVSVTTTTTPLALPEVKAVLQEDLMHRPTVS